MSARHITELVEDIWYGDHPLRYPLIPAGWCYGLWMRLRYFTYSRGIIPVQPLGVPVIVVGNLTVGGTGKTPLIIWLCDYLRQEGYKPGVVSRGYGGMNSRLPQQVRSDSNPYQVGDEPVLIARRTGCPVATFSRRYLAARQLLEHSECDILLCDDGLQHLAVARDIEIAVVDGDRRFGNGLCLPAGPLREPVSRLGSVDMVVANGKAGRNEFLMEYRYRDPVPVRGGRSQPIGRFNGMTVHVVTGIGNPDRFHAWLKKQGLRLITHVYPDHHPFRPKDLHFGDDLPVVMTEKDAVKCRDFAPEDCWYIPIDADPGETFRIRLMKLLRGLSSNG